MRRSNLKAERKFFRLFRGPVLPVIVFLVLAAVCGAVGILTAFKSKEQLAQALQYWIPWHFRLNFFLLFAGILLCIKDTSRFAARFRDRRGLFLGILLAIAFLTASLATTRTHRIYYDEDIYANVAQNIALVDKAGYCNYGTFDYEEYQPHWMTYNKQPSGWPFLVSIAFLLGGVNENLAFLLNNLIFTASIALAFSIGWHLTKRFTPALAAAASYAVIPHNLIWANTASSEPSAAFFSALAVLCLVVYLNSGRGRHLFLLAVVIPPACQMRPESILILFWMTVAVLSVSPRLLVRRQVWAALVLAAVLLAPHAIHMYAMSGHSWGAEGQKFSLEFIGANLAVNGHYYLNNELFPVVLTLLAALGAAAGRLSLRWRGLILLWFACFWGIFLFFYAGSYKYGADVRFALVSFMPLSLCAGLGIEALIRFIGHAASRLRPPEFITPGSLAAAAVALLVFWSSLGFMPLIRREGQEAWGARYDHLHAQRFMEKIPRRSIVLTHVPTMFLLWGQGAIQTYAGVNNQDLVTRLIERYDGNVYFHHGYWCNTKSERNVRLCRRISEIYDLEQVASASEQNFQYTLYKISFK
jgi:4-amino-4-deoxy-L-arabinose transferase-like glycosyltransferase